MNIDPETMLAIVLMGTATYFTRVAGFYLAGRLPRNARMRLALEALPPAVLTAVIAPAVLAGPAEMIAGAVTILAALRLPMIAVVAVAVVTVATTRAIFG
jgi:uncharacterized membrane protein